MNRWPTVPVAPNTATRRFLTPQVSQTRQPRGATLALRRRGTAECNYRGAVSASSHVVYGRLVDRVRDWLGHWIAPLMAALFIATWLLAGHVLGLPPQALDLPLIISLLTLTLVFFSNRAEARDMAALQLKLDEVLTALEEAEGRTVGVERLDKSEVEKLREQHERDGVINPHAGQ